MRGSGLVVPFLSARGLKDRVAQLAAHDDLFVLRERELGGRYVTGTPRAVQEVFHSRMFLVDLPAALRQGQSLNTFAALAEHVCRQLAPRVINWALLLFT